MIDDKQYDKDEEGEEQNEEKVARFIHRKIVTDNVVRDPRIERSIVEYNRDKMLYIMLFLGGALIFLAIMW